MKRKWKRWTACLLAGAMVLLSGCAGNGNTSAEQGGEADEMQTASAGRNEGKEQAMGRYLEEEVILPEEVTDASYPTLCFQKLQDGELVLAEKTAGIYRSPDQGRSWSGMDAPWFRELRDVYIANMAIAPDGAAALVYSPPSDGTEEDSDGGYHPAYLYVDPEGNEKELESPDRNYTVHRFWFGKDSRLYACMMGGKVYEVDPESGEAKFLYETEGLSDYVCFTDRYMLNLTSRELLIYDTENGMPADDDKVLRDFITEHAGEEIGANADAYEMVMAQGEEEDVIYLACSSGLYRHVMGGAAVEQVVEGELSSMGDPSMHLAGMAVLPDHEFAVLYTNGKLYRYVYDPDIPTVPDQQIGIYSLTENYAVRQAVSLFQKQHPEVYIRYEIGMDTNSGMTSEDAVKNLNTRIMSGSGPDLLVLDGLPRHSYEEKGVLTDLSGIVSGMSKEEELFPNMIEACKEDGKLWYLPLRFRLPLLVGDRETLDRISDLTSLADAVEDLREKNPEGMLTGLVTEDQVLRTLGMNCSGVWTDAETGSVDREKLTDFLEQARRIYQAEVSGIEEEELTQYKVSYDSRWNWSGAAEYFAAASSGGMGVAMGEQKIGVGTVRGMDGDFNMISTLTGQEENFGYRTWQGQIRDGFIPKGMIGICAGSRENELALDFFRFLFGREVQDLEMSTGLPVNRASFERLKENPREEDMGISIGTSGADGGSFHLDIRWATEENFEELKQMAESMSGVCAGDAMIEETVYEIGQKALNGSASVEDTVAEIIKKAAIYLSE